MAIDPQTIDPTFENKSPFRGKFSFEGELPFRDELPFKGELQFAPTMRHKHCQYIVMR